MQTKAAAKLSWLERRSSMSTLGKVVTSKKTLNAIIPASGGEAQWTRAQAGNRKVVGSRFGFRIGQCIVVSLGMR